MTKQGKLSLSNSGRLIIHKPKRTRQGCGQHSKPSHGRKRYRGQGRA